MDRLSIKDKSSQPQVDARACSEGRMPPAHRAVAAAAIEVLQDSKPQKRGREFTATSSSAFQKVAKGTPATMYADAHALYMRCTDEDNDRALEIVSRQSLVDHVPSITLMGKIYVGNGEFEDAMDCFHRAAALGGVEAHFELASLYDNGVPYADYNEAYDHYRKAYRRGFSQATYPLAVLVGCGLGCRANIDEALRLLLSVPEDAKVCAHLGRLYLDLERVEEADRYFRKAIDFGDLDVIHEVGELYVLGSHDAITVNYQKALEYYELGVVWGDHLSMVKAGNILLMEDIPQSNTERGIELMERAYAAGNTSAGFVLAKELYETGNIERVSDAIEMLKAYLTDSDESDPDVPNAHFYLGAILIGELDGEIHDRAAALRNLHIAARAKHGDALNLVGTLYEDGSCMAKNEPQAFLLFHAAAAFGSMKGKRNLAECFFLGIGTPRNPERGFQCLYDLKDEDIADVNFSLGRCYRKGLGVRKNEALAFRYTRKAALQGIPSSYLNLGMDYLFGMGTEINYVEAERFLQLDNRTEALFYLGIMAMNGLGKPTRDTALGVELLTAASEDNVSAMMYLAQHYCSGKVLEVDHGKAFALYQKAALANPKNALAPKMVGCMHAEGKGVPKNREQALAWLKLAENLGHQTAFSISEGYKRLWAQEDMRAVPKHLT